MLFKQPYPQQWLSTVKYFILDLFLDVLARGDDTKQTAFIIDSIMYRQGPHVRYQGQGGLFPLVHTAPGSRQL